MVKELKSIGISSQMGLFDLGVSSYQLAQLSGDLHTAKTHRLT